MASVISNYSKEILSTYKKTGHREIVPLTQTYTFSYTDRKIVYCIRNPYFFCSQEPTANKWKEWDLLRNEGQIRHCVPYKNGFFDYIIRKEFPSLESWFEDCRPALGIPADAVMRDSVQYGRRLKCPADRHMEKYIPLREVLEQLGHLGS
jgi:hypothetical protein